MLYQHHSDFEPYLHSHSYFHFGKMWVALKRASSVVELGRYVHCDRVSEFLEQPVDATCHHYYKHTLLKQVDDMAYRRIPSHAYVLWLVWCKVIAEECFLTAWRSPWHCQQNWHISSLKIYITTGNGNNYSRKIAHWQCIFSSILFNGYYFLYQ